MHKLLASCLWGGAKEKGGPWKEVNVYEAPPTKKHAPHNLQSQAHASSPSPPPASTPPAGSPALILPSHCAPKAEPNWEPLSWEATPFSVAIVTSDAKEVLFKKHGLEPAAAQLLDHALLLYSTSRPLDAALAQNGGAMPGSDASSFLTALLGPELEAVAISKARQNRWWKGTISVKLPEQPAAPVQEGATVDYGVAGPCSNPFMTQLSLEGPSPASSANSQEQAPPKRKPSLLEKCMIRESVRSEGTPAGGVAAKAEAASIRQGSAPVELCPADLRSSSDSSARGGGRPAVKWHASSSLRHDDSSKRVQWSSPQVGLQGTSSKSSPLDRVDEGAIVIRKHVQSSPQASLQDFIMSAPLHQTTLAKRRPVRKSKSCLSQQRFDALAGEQDEGEEKGKEETHSPGFLSRAFSSRSKQGMKEPKPATNRAPSRRSSLLLTPEAAIEQLEQGGGSEEVATRTVALLRSLSQVARSVSEDRPVQDSGHYASSPPTQQQQLFDAGVHGTLSYSSVPSAPSHKSHASHTSGLPSTDFDASNEVDAVAPRSTALPPSMKAHENMQAAESFASAPLKPIGNASGPSTNSNLPSAGAVGYSNRNVEGDPLLYQPMAAEQHAYKPQTFASVVRSLEAPPGDSSQMGSANPLSPELFLQLGSSSHLPVCQSSHLNADMSDATQYRMCAEATSLAAPLVNEAEDEPAERISPATSEDDVELPTQSFDVMVTTLSQDPRSPLLVSIFNCTEHWQVRTTLTMLAESQLELLSSIMPQHAIQFLAMESTDAVPEYVGQLARSHSNVTLLFMDIVGFTSMSKNVKPVEVMVFLNMLFSLFDRLTDVHKVHKVETAGDCYIVGGGIMSTGDQTTNGFQCVMGDQDPAESAKQVMEFAKALLETAKQVKMPDTNEPVRVRVGLHTGDVVSGMIGSKMPKFSIFGDAMNTASRMESTGVPGRIHVSETTHQLLPHEAWESTGGVEVKGKGQMQTYLWVPPVSSRPATQQQGQQPFASPSRGDLLPCSFIRQAQQAHTLLKQLGPAPTHKNLGRLNNEVFVAEKSVSMSQLGTQLTARG
mmetsp:Transcript_21429/g.55815  ORF Transcript_21429/g.55815 Transcript_21429/m.55815 type:complete len:1059 (+) Transcript_21429:129-3305(+)